MDDISKQAIVEVCEKYDPHTVVLYGSRARGDATEESDIDIACFVENPSISKSAKQFQGCYLDLWIYSTESMNTWNDDFLRFEDGHCALDKYGFGSKLLEKVSQRVANGPDVLDPVDKKHIIEWSFKMLSRSAKNDIEGNYRRAWLHFDLLESYFSLRDMWYFGPKKSLSWLKANDKKAFALFDKTYKEPQNLEALKQLVKYTTGA